MERDEAKNILELCRPGIDDDHNDPMIAEALAMLESDAELKAWFEEQQEVDARISDSINQIEPPAGLRASIIAGMRAHAQDRSSTSEKKSEDESNKIGKAAILSGKHDKMDAPTTSQNWWRNPWVGIAAVFAILLAIVTIPKDPSPQYADTNPNQVQAGVPDIINFLANELTNIKSRGGFDKASNDLSELQSYLASVGTPSPTTLPRSLDGNKSLGCFTFNYNGAKVGMICFQGDQVVHLITVQKSSCPKSFRPQSPVVYEVENQAFKAWTVDDKIYILSTKGPKEKLPEII